LAPLFLENLDRREMLMLESPMEQVMKIPYMKIPMETHINHFLQTLWSVKTHVDMASDAKDAQPQKSANNLYDHIERAILCVTGLEGDKLPQAKDVPLPAFHLKTVISKDDYGSFKKLLNYFAYKGLQEDLEQLLNRSEEKYICMVYESECSSKVVKKEDDIKSKKWN
jgi:hypothetical protein